MFKKLLEEMNRNYTSICKKPQIFFSTKSFSRLPSYPGVYILYYKRKPLYVGRSNNIKKRFLNQHLSKNDKVSSSSFRKHLKVTGYVKRYAAVRDWVLQNCSLKCIKIDRYDHSILLEALLIALWRKKYALLNDNKYEV